MARPSKFTSERVIRICDALRNGTSRKAASEAASVSYDSFLHWLERGRAVAAQIEALPEDCDPAALARLEGDEFYQFLQSVTRSEAELEANMAAVLGRAADGVPTKRTVKTIKTVIKMRKTMFPKGGTVRTVGPDGRVSEIEYPPGTHIEEPVTLQDKTIQISEGEEYSWQAAESVLKRRRPRYWGDRKQIGVSQMNTEQILALWNQLDEDDDGEEDDAGAEGDA